MLAKFFQIIRDDPQTTHSTEDEDEPIEIKALIAIFCQSVRAFEEHIQFFLDEDILQLESKYQVSMPYVLRGLLIHLLNDTLEETESINVCALVN